MCKCFRLIEPSIPVHTYSHICRQSIAYLYTKIIVFQWISLDSKINGNKNKKHLNKIKYVLKTLNFHSFPFINGNRIFINIWGSGPPNSVQNYTTSEANTYNLPYFCSIRYSQSVPRKRKVIPGLSMHRSMHGWFEQVKKAHINSVFLHCLIPLTNSCECRFTIIHT